jgi:methionine sulfoxide reductase heme-binding subunit
METINQWLKKHGPAIVMTLIALGIIYTEIRAVPRADRLVPAAAMNPLFPAMGKWAIRFLLISLAITPIYALTGWRFLNKLRKPAGVLTFLFVCIHFGIYLSEVFRTKSPYDDARPFINYFTEPQYIIFGLIAFVILALMTATSIKPTMRLMGRFWKPLHRLVYVAGIMMMLHSITAALESKMGFMEGPGYTNELKLYLAILIAELVLRIPGVMTVLKRVLPFVPDGRKSKRKRELVTE